MVISNQARAFSKGDVLQCKILVFIIPLLRHFTILGQKNAQNMPSYYTVEQGKIRTESEATKWLNQTLIFSGIINLLFDGLTYNTSGHFAHCSPIFPRPNGARKNTTQLAKYPRVLYVKPSNKVYILLELI